MVRFYSCKQTEADQQSQLSALSSESAKIKRKKYTKIAFTDLPSQESGEHVESGRYSGVGPDGDGDQSLSQIRNQILKSLAVTDRPLSPDISANSDTESQGDQAQGCKSCYACRVFIFYWETFSPL